MLPINGAFGKVKKTGGMDRERKWEKANVRG